MSEGNSLPIRYGGIDEENGYSYVNHHVNHYRMYEGKRWYWNGTQYVPAPLPASTPIQPQQTVVVNKGVSGSEHMLHLIVTLFTCGMWLPVWAIRAAVGGRSRQEVEPYWR